MLRCADLEMDDDRHVVRRGATEISLTPTEYRLLVYLVKHARRVLTHEQILEEVWGWDYAGGSRSVDVHIRWLREKLETDPSNPERIITLRGVGYRFEG